MYNFKNSILIVVFNYSNCVCNKNILKNIYEKHFKKIISPWTQPWRYNVDKQTYTERELVKNLELIGKHPECIIEKYDTCNWTDSTYETVIDIADYIYEDYIKGGQDGYCYFSFIYNNIIVFIENDSEISIPSIEFKYVKSETNICDLDKIKKLFKFLN